MAEEIYAFMIRLIDSGKYDHVEVKANGENFIHLALARKP